MKQLTEAVLATLIYHDLFDYPLNANEIRKYQISNIPPAEASHMRAGKNQNDNVKIKNGLDVLLAKKKIFKKDGFYFLPRRSKIVSLRQKKEKYSQVKLQKTRKMAGILRLIPEIKMIAVTGTLAMSNADRNDDIDLLIITSCNRLWLTKLKLVILLEILGQRRRPGVATFKDKICLNMFLDETALTLTVNKRNLFTAHEIAQIQPILDRNNTYEKFLTANLWVRDYLPNSITTGQLGNWAIKDKNKKTFNYHFLMTQLINRLEKFIYQLQVKYMKSKKTNENVSQHFAFFHPGHRAERILKKYEQRLKQLK